jgi:hypothetical protein
VFFKSASQTLRALRLARVEDGTRKRCALSKSRLVCGAREEVSLNFPLIQGKPRILEKRTMKTKVMNLLREIATGLAVVVATLVVLYVAVGAACLIVGLCIYLSSDLFANYLGVAILTAAWIVLGIVYLIVCALSNLWNWWDERPNL